MKADKITSEERKGVEKKWSWKLGQVSREARMRVLRGLGLSHAASQQPSFVLALISTIDELGIKSMEGRKAGSLLDLARAQS